MKKLLLISLFFISFYCISQKNETDSLINSIKNSTNNNDKVKTIQKICWKLIYSYTDSCLNYCKQGLKISQEIKNDSLIGKSYNLIGIVYDIKSDWEKIKEGKRG